MVCLCAGRGIRQCYRSTSNSTLFWNKGSRRLESHGTLEFVSQSPMWRSTKASTRRIRREDRNCWPRVRGTTLRTKMLNAEVKAKKAMCCSGTDPNTPRAISLGRDSIGGSESKPPTSSCLGATDTGFPGRDWMPYVLGSDVPDLSRVAAGTRDFAGPPPGPQPEAAFSGFCGAKCSRNTRQRECSGPQSARKTPVSAHTRPWWRSVPPGGAHVPAWETARACEEQARPRRLALVRAPEPTCGRAWQGHGRRSDEWHEADGLCARLGNEPGIHASA